MPALSGWHFYIDLKKNYFFSGAGVAFTGAGVVAAAGLLGVAAAGCVLSIIFESLSLNAPVKLKLESKIKAIKIVANVQVLLSKKSVVF